MEILLGGLGILIILIIVILLISYRKAGPNEVLVITGGALRGPFVQVNEITHSRVKIVKGGGVFVIPIIQQAQVQTLGTFNIDVTVDNIMTSSMVPVNASANAVLRVSSDPKLIAVAAEKTLGLDAQERDAQMTEIVKGGLREVLSALTPKEANNRSDFQNKVRDSIVSTFETLGLEITNLQITSINDNNGYYENLAAQEIADKQAGAEKAKAEADRVARLARAENDQEAKKAELQADQAIAENQRNTDIAKAQYNAQVQAEKAKADQAYALNQAQAEQAVKEAQIIVRQKELEGTQVAEQEAKAKVIRSQATADAFATETQAEANAKQIRIEGTARAETQTRLAAAFADHGQELLAQAVIEHLPTMAGQFATAIGNIDQLTVFDGADGVTNQANAGLAETLTFIKQATGVDITDVINQRAKGMTTVTGKLPVELQQAADKLVEPLKGNEQHK